MGERIIYSLVLIENALSDIMKNVQAPQNDSEREDNETPPAGKESTERRECIMSVSGEVGGPARPARQD